ncbi:YicC/YloC family endoribonuclease [Aquibacillus salsiterrae]|uniref:YicC family protein n=1 Tax=Aquibacillus salsiterrae TaxID=2950439 RepID=A0A9X3WFF9_9BACI|nr:YicC/YloC family endoribonuclease [Aquibacillus salsiterrae]MDC3416449.1 YicC family protein [Aquibacillus salsiterrae]
MIKSMTGYGRKVVTVDQLHVTVEIRSVNHRFLDISTKLPHHLFGIENKVKQVIKNHFSRGRVELFLSVDGEGYLERKLRVDWNLVDQYVDHLKTLKQKFSLSGEPSLAMMTNLENLFLIEETESPVDSIKDSIITAVGFACEEVVKMRKKEGELLEQDLRNRINLIKNIVKMLGDQREIVIIEYQERILKRIQSYINDYKEISSEDTKLVQDVALLAEKGDITEEVTRLMSHLQQFSAILNQEEAIGRKLDFITQEMHREANTIGAKSNDAEISEYVVELKSEIEKIKEQIQNVE